MNQQQWQTEYTLPNGTILQNRLVFAPVSTMSSTRIGLLTQKEMKFYQERAKNSGVVILGSANVSFAGKAYERNVSISHDAVIPNLKHYNQLIRKNGSKSFVQLYHGGAAVQFLNAQKEVRVISELPEMTKDSTKKYMVLSDQEIHTIIAVFGNAIIRAIRSEFDGIEIHAGNPFLIQQFLSPRTNRRNDFWGGSESKRFHFLEALVREALAIREKVKRPELVIGVRLALEESGPEGLTFQDTCRITQRLSLLGLDYIHFNQQNLFEKEKGTRRLDLLQQNLLRPVSLIGNGGIKTEEGLEEAINTVPLVSVGRSFILQSEFPRRKVSLSSLKDLDQDIPQGLRQSILDSPAWYLEVNEGVVENKEY